MPLHKLSIGSPNEKLNYLVQQDEDLSFADRHRALEESGRTVVRHSKLKTRFTLDFLGIWEQLHNPQFNRVEFDTFKNEGTNAFVMTPQKWITATGAIDIVSKSGRHGGGTFAHQDIAFEFATWIPPEFKLYLIEEFQRLKLEENERKQLGWDVKRNLARINYRVHTDAIKAHLIPQKLTPQAKNFVYADEADVLNKACSV